MLLGQPYCLVLEQDYWAKKENKVKRKLGKEDIRWI